MLQVGKPAPQFTLEAFHLGEFKRLSLADFKGKWTVLFFYPRDFTFVCPTEIRDFNTRLDEFKAAGGEVLSCSTDSNHSHKAWSKELGDIKYPMLADVTHAVSRDYDVLVEESGEALRGTFIIDPEGILRYMVVSDMNVGRSVEETLRVLNALQTGELCPAEWKPGQKTLGKA